MTITVRYEFNVEGYKTIWGAHGGICEQALMYGDDVVSVVRNEKAHFELLPTLDVTFKSREAAKQYTCVWMGGADDADIEEYLYFATGGGGG